MKNIKEIGDFFINLNEYVYATDIETNEIVYMNHKALEAYGLESIEDIKGLKCYEVLQKASVKCGMCNNSRLLPGAFDEWRYYNPVLDKYMIIKDTLIEGEGNRKYRLEIGIDISEELAQDKLIQKYRETEALVNEGLREALAADTPDETINTLLGYIGKALNGERTYIFEKNIYEINSLFLGFIISSIPLIVKSERKTFIDNKKNIIFIIYILFYVIIY